MIGLVVPSAAEMGPCGPIRSACDAKIVSPNGPDDEMGPVRFAWLELTPHCNLRCLHCYADSTPERRASTAMEVADWKRTLRVLNERRCAGIQFIGGEPMLHPAFEELVSFSRSLAFARIEVFTNGTALTDNNIDFLSQHGVHLNVSVYSHDAAAHDHVTGVDGSWQRSMAGLQRAVGRLSMHCAVVAVASNTEPSDTVEFLRGIGISSISVHQTRPVGRGITVTRGESKTCGQCNSGCIAIGYDGLVRPCVFRREEILASVDDYLTG